MTKLLIAFVMVFGGYAFADNPGEGGAEPVEVEEVANPGEGGTEPAPGASVIRARSMTCSDLQDAIAEYGSVTIKSGISRTTVSSSADCGMGQTAKVNHWRTSDKSWFRPCAAGYTCESNEPLSPDDSEDNGQ